MISIPEPIVNASSTVGRRISACECD